MTTYLQGSKLVGGQLPNNPTKIKNMMSIIVSCTEYVHT